MVKHLEWNICLIHLKGTTSVKQEQEQEQEQILFSIKQHNLLLAYIIYTIQCDRKQGIQHNNCHFKVYYKEKALIRSSKDEYLLKYV